MLVRIFTLLSILIGAPVCFAQSPHLEVTPTNVTDLSIRWSSVEAGPTDDPSPVVRATLHGPFNTVEGATPSDPTNPDALCTGIAKVWYDQTRSLTSTDGTYCNPDDDGLCPIDPDRWFGDIPDDSTGPLAGMRAPHCQLNICGNTDPAVWPDQGACVDSRGNMVGDGGHEIKVEHPRTSGTYFLVFEKEDGTTDIFRKELTESIFPAPDCGDVTALISTTRPEVTFTLNPMNTTHVVPPTGCSGPTAIAGPGSQNYTCPVNSERREFDFTCQGAGSVTRRFSVELGRATPFVDCAAGSAASCMSDQSPVGVTLHYGVTRTASVLDLDRNESKGSMMKPSHPSIVSPTSPTTVPWTGFLLLSSVDASGFETILDFQWPPTADKTAHASRDYEHFKYKVRCFDFDGGSCGTLPLEKPYTSSYVHALQDNQLPPPNSRNAARRHATQTFCEASWNWNDSCNCSNPWDNGIFGGCEDRNDGHWSFLGGPEPHHRFIQMMEGLNVKDHINVFCSRDQSRYSQKRNDYNILAQSIEDQLQGLKGYGIHQVTVNVPSIRETFWCGGTYHDEQGHPQDLPQLFSTCDPSSFNYFRQYGDQAGGCSVSDAITGIAEDAVAVGSALGLVPSAFGAAAVVHICIQTGHCGL